MSSKAVVFRDRLFLLGGGKLDGPNANDVWRMRPSGLQPWR